MSEFTRLAALWKQLGPSIGGDEVSVSMHNPDRDVSFHSNDYTVHLHRDNSWWIMDTVNDRNQRRNAAARFSSFSLAEKYLLWDWATTAFTSLASGPLGADLARQGFSSQVSATKVEGGYEICSASECAILSVVNATIFSHLISHSFEEIERKVNICRGNSTRP
ncbi:hypothetical protein [Mycolicibacterium thermoresistibile]